MKLDVIAQLCINATYIYNEIDIRKKSCKQHPTGLLSRFIVSDLCRIIFVVIVVEGL